MRLYHWMSPEKGKNVITFRYRLDRHGVRVADLSDIPKERR
jgi:hypothetical protein